MAGRRKRKKHQIEYEDAELNIMPFIDVFSVLNTFLLFSAVFVALGIVKVQVPFFTNKEDPEKPTRSLQVEVDAERDKIVLMTKYSLPPLNAARKEYTANKEGLDQLHDELVQIRSQNLDTDLVTLYTQDDILYSQIIELIDAIKNRRKEDPEFITEDMDEKDKLNKNFVFPKVVMGSVIL